MGPEELAQETLVRIYRRWSLVRRQPLPPGAVPRSFTSFDAAGQELARGTEFAGYPNCRP